MASAKSVQMLHRTQRISGVRAAVGLGIDPGDGTDDDVPGGGEGVDAAGAAGGAPSPVVGMGRNPAGDSAQPGDAADGDDGGGEHGGDA